MTIIDFLALMLLDRNLSIGVGTVSFQRHLPGGSLAACPPKEGMADFLTRNPGFTPPEEITAILEGAD
ncbi:MAG: hypothetical protein JWP91_782 [Fibrobacteres bacterium]|nr:hypothetical protein [Fibrobacterota bacterium]